LRQQLSILKTFLYGFQFTKMKPDDSVISSISPKLTGSALVQPGEAYAIYLHVPLPNKPQRLQEHLQENISAQVSLKLPSGEFEAEWVDTKTGAVKKSQKIDHTGGNCQLHSPEFTNDIALRIVRQSN